jgi:hypothetical protein
MGLSASGEFSPNSLADWLGDCLLKISDFSMPRNCGVYKKVVYWWNDKIAELRSQVNKIRRKLTRIRKTNSRSELIKELYNQYKEILKEYKRSIIKSKRNSWKELLRDLDREPWGVAFKIATLKIKPAMHSFCEAFPWETVKVIVNNLFPKDKKVGNIHGPLVWTEDKRVTLKEVKDANKKLHNDKKAPGPDGILGGVVKYSMEGLVSIWAKCYTECLKNGVFPKNWKVAKLVLLKKKERVVKDHKIYRPICLLNESAKLFERIIVNRINGHLKDSNGLHKNQFGFLAERSTVDAMIKLKEIVSKNHFIFTMKKIVES